MHPLLLTKAYWGKEVTKIVSKFCTKTVQNIFRYSSSKIALQLMNDFFFTIFSNTETEIEVNLPWSKKSVKKNPIVTLNFFNPHCVTFWPVQNRTPPFLTVFCFNVHCSHQRVAIYYTTFIHWKVCKDQISQKIFPNRVQIFRESHKNLTKSPCWFEIFKVNIKSTGRFCRIFVAFLENLNFTFI